MEGIILGRAHNGLPVRQGTPLHRATQAQAIRREQVQQSLMRRTLPDQTLLVNDLGAETHEGAMELPLGITARTVCPHPPNPARFQGRQIVYDRPPIYNQPLAIRRLARGRDPPPPSVARFGLPQEIIEGRSLLRETQRAMRGGMNTERGVLPLMRQGRPRQSPPPLLSPFSVDSWNLKVYK
tara:strand:+ start:1639 stop:2184 length:546 start_codon:yes stop_codon:yes gene_type:complete